MDNKKREQLKEMAKKIRTDIVEMLCVSGSGHPGGSLSATDIVTYLYFSGELNIDPKDPGKKDRDRVVLSKGHACPVMYAALAEKGYFDKSELKTLRKFGSMLQGHPDMNKVPGIEISTGSLGQGLSCSVGMALGAKLDNSSARVFTIVGDGECDEGQVWEAAMAAAHFKLDNLLAIVDRNKIQLDSWTHNIMNLEPFVDKWKGFGWHTIEIDGHSFPDILAAFDKARTIKGGPTVIIANTVKGKGVSYMENNPDWHGKAPNDEQYEIAMKELA